LECVLEVVDAMMERLDALEARLGAPTESQDAQVESGGYPSIRAA
jgi:hypothetical protein